MTLSHIKYLLTVATFAAVLVGRPANAADFSNIRQASSLETSLRRICAEANPAVMPYLLPSSLSDISLGGRWNHDGDTRPVEEGTGELSCRVMASSYNRLSPAITVWGHARFTAAKIRDVKWTNATDNSLVGPYVFGDAVGGDLVSRSYDFSGGYAGSAGAWTWGAQGAYRAQLDYRNRDPRDKIVVSDLNLALGGTRRLGRLPLAIGVATRLRIYHQTTDLQFYNPLNDIYTFALTGLGTIYPRFSGDDEIALAYNGTGFGADLTLSSTAVAAQQYAARISAGHIRIRQFLRAYNNLELTHTSTDSLSIQLSALTTAGCARFGATLRGTLFRKTGTENIFGTSSGNTYPVLGSRDNYRHTSTLLQLSLPGSFTLGKSDRLISAIGGDWEHNSQKVTSPHREITVNRFSLSTSHSWWHTLSQKTALEVKAEAAHCFVNPQTILLGNGSTDETGTEATAAEPGNAMEALHAATLHNAAVATSDVTLLLLGAGFRVALSQGGVLNIHADWRHSLFNRQLGDADRISLCIGVTL